MLIIKHRKKGKKLKEKRSKENSRKKQKGHGPNIQNNEFMGVEFEDSIYAPWLNEDGTVKDGVDQSVD